MKTAQLRPELSFDGCGINGPDEFRSRIATFDRARLTSRQLEHYGRLFEAAPELLDALCAALPFVEDALQFSSSDFKPGFVADRVKMIRAAIAKAGKV